MLGLCHREMWELSETNGLCFTVTSLCARHKAKELPNAKTFSRTLLPVARVLFSKPLAQMVRGRGRKRKLFRYDKDIIPQEKQLKARRLECPSMANKTGTGP